MNKKNFNSISQFSVPQNWIDEALNIPNQKKKKKPLLLFKNSRTLAAVASLVIVCCVSLMLFFLTDDNAKPPINPTQNESVQSFTDSVSTQTNSEVQDATENKGENNTGFIEPTEEPQTVNPSTGSSSTVNPSIKPTTKPTEKPIGPTQKPTIEPSEPPTEPDIDIPTEPDVGDPTTPVKPTSKPIRPTEPSPTEPCPTEPWYPPPFDPTEPCPTEPVPTEPSIHPTVTPTYNVVVSTKIKKVSLKGAATIYCRVYDTSSSKMYGDPNLLSSQHLARIIPSIDENVTLYYGINRSILGNSGYYRFVFYDSNCTTITECTVYVS